MEQIQKNTKENLEQIELYISAAWNLSYSAYWELLDFSAEEIRTAKEFIRRSITSENDAYMNYLNFCQRVLMAYMYIKREHNKYIPIPSIWFDEGNTNGYAGTIKWMNSLSTKRKSLPLFRIELKAMAEAILEMNEEPCMANFRYWRSYLLERKQNGLYSLFVSVVMNGLLCKRLLN